jgi:hypothetical protein
MRVPMPPHGQVQRMRCPSTARRANALPVQRGGEIRERGDPRQTEIVQQEANVRRQGGAMLGSHVFRGLKGHQGYGDCCADFPALRAAC